VLPFARVSIIGMGLIGSSLARAVRARLPTVRLSVTDADPAVRARVIDLDLADDVADSPGAAVIDADFVILCVPVGAMAGVAASIADDLSPGCVVSDVGSVKGQVLADLTAALPGVAIVPAHPVAGTEKSGPDAGFASLFAGRWCILTPAAGTDPVAVERVRDFWTRLGAPVETMDAAHHDLVLAVTSHLPHLIAYSIVGTASDMEAVTRSEVFTRIAASDPVMWRDVFLSNKDAVLDVLQRFTEDLTALQRAIRWGDGDALEALFTRTRDVRRTIVDAGQDTDDADFGRRHD
jgi:cyclohexadieny/prephenate dehydrogenase